MSETIKIDRGLKSFNLEDSVTGEIYGEITFNPADLNILERFSEGLERIKNLNIDKDIKLNEKGNPIENMKETAELIKTMNNKVFEIVDYIFDAEISKTVFANISPFATVKGKWFVERFIKAVEPHIKKEIEKENKASEQRISKYTAPYKKKK